MAALINFNIVIIYDKLNNLIHMTQHVTSK